MNRLTANSVLTANSDSFAYDPYNGEEYCSERFLVFQDELTKSSRSLKVLVALDSSQEREELVSSLSAIGFQVDAVDNGWSCLQKAKTAKTKQTPFDLVVLGVDLTVLDGFTIARKLKNLELTRLIITTAKRTMFSYEDDSKLSGCDAFMPYDKLLYLFREFE